MTIDTKKEIETILGKYRTGVAFLYDSDSDKNIPHQDDVLTHQQSIEAILALFTQFAEKREKEVALKISTWATKNYSRSPQPLYAHVDLKDLMNFISEILPIKEENQK